MGLDSDLWLTTKSIVKNPQDRQRLSCDDIIPGNWYIEIIMGLISPKLDDFGYNLGNKKIMIWNKVINCFKYVCVFILYELVNCWLKGIDLKVSRPVL